jgi:iron complex transport system ATP-binding protein
MAAVRVDHPSVRLQSPHALAGGGTWRGTRGLKGAAVQFEQVTLRRSSQGVQRLILDAVDWTAASGEHWGIVGPNGAGKTTLLRLASAQMRPTAGVVRVLGEQLGRTSMPALRRRIGLVEPAFARRFYPEQRAIDVVLSGLTGSILLVDELSAGEPERAQGLLDAVGIGALASRTFASCSEGERARILLARALIADAPLLVLDEPAAGLDLGGRELLLGAFERAVAGRPDLTTLTVTHHIEELPPATTHALLLRDGKVIAAGPVAAALNDATLSECFGLPLRVERAGGRTFVLAGR